MTRDEVRQMIRDNVPCERYLKKSEKGEYICPFCGSGTHEHKTGALYVYDTNTWACFACKSKGAGKYSGDVIDLFMKTFDTDYNSALYTLAEELHLTIDEAPAREYQAPKNGRQKAAERPQTADKQKADKEKAESQTAAENGTQPVIYDEIKEAIKEANAPDYTAYYKLCRERLEDPAAALYLNGRGISLETARRYYIGYDPAADPASAPGATGNQYKPHPAPRIIMPTSKSHYVARAINSDMPARYQKLNAKGSNPYLFNWKALERPENDVVFIVESITDALSIIECGAAAVALNSAENAKVLLNYLDKHPTKADVVLCFDNDSDPEINAGIRSQEQGIIEAIQFINNDASRVPRWHVTAYTADILAEYKDANDRLVNDREGLKKAIEGVLSRHRKPDSTADYLDGQFLADIMSFGEPITTGFNTLDQAMNGGLYPGLYTLAAIPGLGKTTLALQLCDQLAESGQDVIYFALEMSRFELVSKSLSRILAQADIDSAVTNLAIRRGWSRQKTADAARIYKTKTGGRVSIKEGSFTTTAGEIRNYTESYAKRNKVKPIVIIDYLQVIRTVDKMGRPLEGKEAVDFNIVAMKRLSRDLNTIVISVCSLNRASYMLPVSYESLKESGSLEYTSDVIFGLQLACLDEDIFQKNSANSGNLKEQRARVEAAKEEKPRKIRLVCLKNRFGTSHFELDFDYWPAFDLFIAKEPKKQEQPQPTRRKGRA